MSKRVRVRFAPSPTGALHMGGMRTALYNYLFAKKHGGDFILRIEDTDSARFVPGAEEYIIESLKWAGICPNEGFGFGEPPGGPGPYKQSERKEHGIYITYLGKLIADGHAYYAFDTKEDMDAMRDRMIKSGNKTSSYDYLTRENMKNSLVLSADEVDRRIASGEPYVVRIKMPRHEDIKFKDLIRGNMSVKSSTIDDKILFKSDGMPTYHFANVVDDYDMKITHVIRGEEWLPSAPLHVYLYRCLGWEAPEFVHLPLIMGPDGKKLSKRDGDKYGFPVFPLPWSDAESGEKYMNFRSWGYLPEAFINMIALLGWNAGGDLEIMSLDEMVEKFSFERVNKAGARFDLKKAGWMNGAYMMKTDNMKLAEMFTNVAVRTGDKAHILDRDFDMSYIASACGLIKQKVNYMAEFWEAGKYFFSDPKVGDPVWHDLEKLPSPGDYPGEMLKFATGWTLSKNTWWTHDECKSAFDTAVKECGIDARDAGKFLRSAITGMRMGPPLFDIMALLGPEICRNRISACLQ